LLPALVLMLAATREGDPRPTLPGVWAQVRYSVPLGLAGMFVAIAWSLDKVIVSWMCSTEQFAVYRNGALRLPLVGIVTASVTSVLLPDLARYFKAGQRAEAVALWGRAAAKCALVMFPAMCFFLVMAPEVMVTLFRAQYLESSVPFRLYQLVLPIRIVTFGAMLMAAGKSRVVLKAAVVGLVVNLVLSVVLVKLVGYIGAVIGTILTIYLWTIPYYVRAILREYGTSLAALLPYRTLAKILAVSLAGCAVLAPKVYLGELGYAGRLALCTPLYGAVVVGLFLWFRLVDYGTLRRSLARVFRGKQ